MAEDWVRQTAEAMTRVLSSVSTSLSRQVLQMKATPRDPYLTGTLLFPPEVVQNVRRHLQCAYQAYIDILPRSGVGFRVLVKRLYGLVRCVALGWLVTVVVTLLQVTMRHSLY